MKYTKFLIIAFILFVSTRTVYSQDSICGTIPLSEEATEKLPWYNNNDYLVNFLDSLEKNNSGMRIEREVGSEIFQVPVQVWIYRNTNLPDTVPKTWHIARWINIMNEMLEESNIPIKLYTLCQPLWVYNNKYYERSGFSEVYESMITENYNEEVLNIHFVRRTSSSAAVAQAEFPIDDRPYNNYVDIFSPYSFMVATNVDNDPIEDDDAISNISFQKEFAANMLHEFGHTLGLFHTHHGRCRNRGNNADCGRCRQEYVDRNRQLGGFCWASGIGAYASEVNADLLRDTEADPYLGYNEVDRFVDENCNYTPTITNSDGDVVTIRHTTDNDGVTWTPPTRNIMSYSRLSCINEFTTLQWGVMRHFVPNISYPAVMDEYENDNEYQVANFVDINRFPRQYHTFHNNLGSFIDESSCDEDWLKFELNSQRKVIVVTRPAPVNSSLNADTYIELYKEVVSNGVVSIARIATDDDSSPYGVGFSRIEEDNLTGGIYYVRVRNKLKEAGHYVIGIFPERENWGSYPSGTGGGGSGNPDGEIDFGVDDPTTGGDIDGNGTLDYVCDGAQLNLQGLDGDSNWSVQWSTNNTSVSATNGFIQTGGFSGEVIITALIYYNGALVGNTMQTIWVGAPERPILTVGNIRGNNNEVCQGEDLYLSAANTGRGFASSYKWELYKNGIQIFEFITPTPDFPIDRVVTLSITGTYQAYVSACNECGCNCSFAVTLTVLPISHPDCGRPGRGKIQINSIIQNEIIIYPNPVTNKLTIKLPSIYSENSTQIELYNSIGQLVLSKSYTETNIELPVSSYPKGLYILKIQNGKEMKTEKIVIE